MVVLQLPTWSGVIYDVNFYWSSNRVWNVKDTGEFYSSEETVDTLQSIADKKQHHQVRISGGKSTIGKQHQIEIRETIKQTYWFILEANTISLGYDKKYVEDLSVFENLNMRFYLKGADSEEFTLFTAAETSFEYQLTALQHLRDLHMNSNVSLVSKHQKKNEFFYQVHRNEF